MEQEATYLKGFNAGHRLANYEPELLEKLIPSLSETNEYEKGILDGVRQFEKEKEQEQNRLNELDNIRNESGREEKDIER